MENKEKPTPPPSNRYNLPMSQETPQMPPEPTLQPSMTPEGETNNHNNPVPPDQGFKIALLASLPVTLITLAAELLQATANKEALIASVLIAFIGLGVFFFWQIKNVQQRMEQNNFPIPTYWQILILFLVFGFLATIFCGLLGSALGIAIGAVVVGASTAGGSGFVIGAISALISVLAGWGLTALLVGRKLGKPFSEEASKIVSIIALVCVYLPFTLISLGGILIAAALFSL